MSLISCLLFSACAQIAPPSGGPPDTIPPSIVSTSPSNGATHIPLDTPIRIRFSEPIDRISVESSLFIAPDPTMVPTLRWHNEELKIIIPDSLQPMRTYTVTIGSGTRDVHGNMMIASYTFAFATGDRIDNGKITGYVTFSDRPAIGSMVWLYDLKRYPTPDPSQDRPDYRTQTGIHGEYRFSSLAWSSYRLFAISDRDRDGHYTPEADLIAVPSHDAFLHETTDQMTMNDLVLTSSDTTGEHGRTPAIVDTIATAERLLGTISGTISTQDTQEKPLCYLRAMSTEENKGHVYLTSRLPGQYDWQLPSGHYRLSAFLDENMNSIHDGGKPLPFTPSEPSRSLPDTILVRARWETRGIDFSFNR